MFSKLLTLIRTVIHKLIPYKTIESVEQIESPLSSEMATALDLWYDMYRNKSPWLAESGMQSLGLAPFVCSEIARQVCLEMKWSITGKATKDGEPGKSPRAEYLAKEFEKCVAMLREKLEQGCAAGGMIIKPYPKNGHIYFDWTMDWSMYPIAFDDDGMLSDVIFRDTYTIGKNIFSRLERHTVEGSNVKISHRVFKSGNRDSIGTEVSLSEVPIWAELKPEATVTATDGQLFGWYRVAQANNVDVDSPMGASVFAKACGAIHDADEQYSRLMWEFKGSELAIDVDPTVLRPKKGKDGKEEMPKLDQRLFRAVDRGTDDSYDVFSPTIRDASLINGLVQILYRVEDLCGLARGTITEAQSVAKTATELNILKNRSYSTIADNQQKLETCLRDVIRAMDKYATLYKLAPEGEYEVSFEWDDSIINDTATQLGERLTLLNAGVSSRQEIREWYYGETPAQAKAAILAADKEKLDQMAGMEALIPKVTP